VKGQEGPKDEEEFLGKGRGEEDIEDEGKFQTSEMRVS